MNPVPRRHFTHEENITWFNDNPAKRAASFVALFSPSGELLIVRSTYSAGWGLVGGVVEAGESPLVAALREAKEEVGLTIPDTRTSFLGTVYAPPAHGYLDAIYYIFTVRLSAAEVTEITPLASEIAEASFYEMAALPEDSRVVVKAVRDILASGRSAGYYELGKIISSS